MKVGELGLARGVPRGLGGKAGRLTYFGTRDLNLSQCLNLG